MLDPARAPQQRTVPSASSAQVVTLPAEDAIARFLQRVLPSKAAYALVRWKNVLLMMGSFNLSRWKPDFMRKVIRRGVEKHLPAGYDVDTHFNPRYNPWQQRMCLVPDSDLFEALADGSASVVTDGVETFTETGVRLTSGEALDADIIVTATGLNLLLLGGIEVSLDGEPVDFSKKVAYKGMMICGVPNLAVTLGYTNASWTLKCDLVSHYVCRLLNHMDEQGHTVCTPAAPDPSVTLEPFIDFNSGYVLRSIDTPPPGGCTRTTSATCGS